MIWDDDLSTHWNRDCAPVTDPFGREDVPLGEFVAKVEKKTTVGLEALELEISRVVKLFDLFLQSNSSSEKLRRHAPSHVSAGNDRRPCNRDMRELTDDDADCARGSDSRRERPCQKPAISPDAEVHRLHQLLRRLSSRTVAEPGSSDNAPGYYAVYFTDEGNGIEVEYVHTEDREVTHG